TACGSPSAPTGRRGACRGCTSWSRRVLAEPAAALPLRPWLQARWLARLAAALAAGALVAACGHGAAMLGVATLVFCAGGLAGHRRATRWFRARAGAPAMPLRLTSARRPGPLVGLAPTAALLVLLGLGATARGGETMAAALASV